MSTAPRPRQPSPGDRPPPSGARVPRCGGTPPSPLRREVEQASAAVLVRLARVPRAVLALTVGLVLLAALLLGGAVGTTVLTFVVLLMVWLTYLAWPTLGPAARALRLAVLAALVAALALGG